MNKTDLKIFELIDILKDLGMIRYDKDFCEAVGVLKQNLSRIKDGKAHFTTEHVRQVCEVYKVNANWIFDTEIQVFRTIKSVQKVYKTS